VTCRAGEQAGAALVAEFPGLPRVNERGPVLRGALQPVGPVGVGLPLDETERKIQSIPSTRRTKYQGLVVLLVEGCEDTVHQG
jgi:hypothetical protein